MRPCPKGKAVFESMEDAKRECSRLSIKNYKEGRRMKIEHGIRVKREKVRPYICGFCGQWHVGRGAKGADADWNTRPVFIARPHTP